MPKVISLLILLSTYTFANAQCDLKLNEKMVKQIQSDGYTYLKDFFIEVEEINSSKAYSLFLNKNTHYFLYFGVSDNDGSEIEFTVTTDKTEVKKLTVSSFGKISIIEITPKESALYNITARSTKGKKSCGIIVLGKEPTKNSPDTKTTADNKDYFIMVDEMPEFILGEKDAFQSWVKNNFKYPEVASKKGITGKVFISFVVNKVGDVTNINVVRGVDREVDAFLVNELKKCPRWQKPGKDKGKPVKVQFVIYIAVKP